jgi:hypothetical protein
MNFQKLTQQILESVDDKHREIYYNIISQGSMNTFMDEALKLNGTTWFEIWDTSDRIDVYNTFEEGAIILSKDCGFTTRERERFKQTFEPYLHLKGKWKSVEAGFGGKMLILYGIEVERISGLTDTVDDEFKDSNIIDW